MSKNKKMNPAAIKRQMEALEKQYQEAKERLSGVIATALLDSDMADKLGDYSEAEIRQIVLKLAPALDTAIAQFERDKASKAAQRKVENRPSVAPPQPPQNPPYASV